MAEGLTIPNKPKAIARSDSWPIVRRQHLREQPNCQSCGSKTKLEVHHIIPVHIDATKELDPTNMITLCENTASGFCHYIFGHLAISWWKYDPDVKANVFTHWLAVNRANTKQDAKGKPIFK